MFKVCIENGSDESGGDGGENTNGDARGPPLLNVLYTSVGRSGEGVHKVPTISQRLWVSKVISQPEDLGDARIWDDLLGVDMEVPNIGLILYHGVTAVSAGQ